MARSKDDGEPLALGTGTYRPEVKSVYVTGPCAAMKEPAPVLPPPKESGTAFCRPFYCAVKNLSATTTVVNGPVEVRPGPEDLHAMFLGKQACTEIQRSGEDDKGAFVEARS
jgi:hypothetical protein